MPACPVVRTPCSNRPSTTKTAATKMQQWQQRLKVLPALPVGLAGSERRREYFFLPVSFEGSRLPGCSFRGHVLNHCQVSLAPLFRLLGLLSFFIVTEQCRDSDSRLKVDLPVLQSFLPSTLKTCSKEHQRGSRPCALRFRARSLELAASGMGCFFLQDKGQSVNHEPIELNAKP